MTDLESMKFYIVVPQAATNYVTNPTPYRATTGYTAVVGSIAASTISGRRGPLCIKVTPTTALSGVYFGTVSVTNGDDYVFSCDVKGEAGKTMQIKVMDAGESYQYWTTFTATGYWQRVEVTFTAQEDASDYRLFVLRNATTGTTAFHVDGFQFETGTEATTFFSGDSKGFGIAPLEFYWGGTPHASVSYRTADTRAGGRLLDVEIDAYKLISTVGLGMGSYRQIYSELSSGGAYYQKHIRKPRNFSLLLQYHGSNPGDLHDARNAIIEAVRPDYTGYEQPLIIRYQGYNSSGIEATQPLDIVCIPQGGHESLPDEPINNRDILNFTVLDSHLGGAYVEGAELGLYDEITASDYVIYRDANGVWQEVNNSGTDLNGVVYCIAEAPNGDIYLGGNFTNAGGDGDADYLCKWDGSALSAVVAGFNNNVNALAFDANGDLYVGGAFTDVGDSNGDRIVKITDLNGTPTVNSLGTGCAGGAVTSLAIDNNGIVMVGGYFTSAGGVSDTAYFATYNGSTWQGYLNLSLTDYVLVVANNPLTNRSYIGGAFTGASGGILDYFALSIFGLPLDTQLNSAVYDVEFDAQGNVYICGAFTDAGGDANADRIVKLINNETLVALSDVSTFNDTCRKLYFNDNKLYAVGRFTTAAGLSADRIAVYKGGAWKAIEFDPPGTDPIYTIVETSRGELWIGGNYTGTGYANDSIQVINSGNAVAYPTIEITGPGVLQSITNYTTDNEIQFDGLTLQAGEIITLKLDPTDLDMTSTWVGRGNLLKYVNPGSDLGQFYLKPDTNYISLFMPTGTTSATKAYVYWTPKFWNVEGSRYE